MEYTKPFLTYEQQATRLIDERGMIANRDNLIRHLQDVGYYRLSGYWHIYKKSDTNEFWENTTFQMVWDLYVFDRQFRLLVFDAIERFEIYMRTQLAYLLAKETGLFGYFDSKNLPRLNEKDYARFIERCKEAYERAKNGEPFAKHFQDRYGDEHDLPPYWILVNVMDFGMIGTLYKGAPVNVRKKIAEDLELQTTILDSWMLSINTVRNICAHHGRLWNRVLGNPPKIPRTDDWQKPYKVENGKIFGMLTILSYLLGFVAPDTSWRKRLIEKIGSITKANQERMGFVGDWESCPMWSKYLPKDEKTNAPDVTLTERGHSGDIRIKSSDL